MEIDMTSSFPSLLVPLAENAETSGQILLKIDARFISSRPARYRELIEGDATVSGEMKIGGDGFTYALDQIAYVHEVEFAGEVASERPPTLRIEALLADGGEAVQVRTRPHPEKPNVLVATIGKIIRGIRIAPDMWVIVGRRFKVSHISILGRSMVELASVEATMSEYISLREKFREELANQVESLTNEKERLRIESGALITRAMEQSARLAAEKESAAVEASAEEAKNRATLEAIQAEHTAALKALADLKTSVEAVNGELSKLSAEKAGLTTEYNTLVVSTDECRKKESDLRQHIAEKVGELARKTAEAGRLEDKLRQLQSSVSVYSENLDGFSTQGDREIESYMPIIYSCLTAGSVVSFLVIWYTLALPDAMTAHPTLTISHILILKSLVVAGFLAFMTFLTKFANPYLVAIRSIKQQRRSVNAVNMLAREIADSALQGEGASDGDRAALRLAVKMKWMQDILPEIIGMNVADIPAVKGTDFSKFSAKLIESLESRRGIPKPDEPTELAEVPRARMNN